MFALAILLLLLVFLTTEVVISKRSLLSTGKYDRYLDPLWAQEIIKNGAITNNPFPTGPSLFSNANSYGFNLLPAMSLVVNNLLSGIGVLSLHSSPLFALFYFVSLFLAAHALYGERRATVLLSLFLGCLFFYVNNAILHEMNRIALAYSVFFVFVYAYLKTEARARMQFHLLAVFLLLLFVFTYSSDAVTALVLVFVFIGLEARRSRKHDRFNLVALYFTTCIAYYLIATDFLAAGFRSFKAALEFQGFSIDFSTLFRPSGWPARLQYIPQYSPLDWFLLAYPLAVLGFLFAGSIVKHWKAVRRLRPTTPFESLWIASMFYVVAVLVANASALLPSAGLDFVAIFGWLAPLLCAEPRNRLINFGTLASSPSPLREVDTSLVDGHSASGRQKGGPARRVVLAAVTASLILGSASVVNYYGLQPRTGEVVGAQEVAAANWLGNSKFVVVSDLHFLSTYVAVADGKALHFLPLDRGSIESTFYAVNLSFIESHGADAFVVTNIMESDYISHFDGTRTVANPSLGQAIGSQWNRIYDNGADQIYTG